MFPFLYRQPLLLSCLLHLYLGLATSELDVALLSRSDRVPEVVPEFHGVLGLAVVNK